MKDEKNQASDSLLFTLGGRHGNGASVAHELQAALWKHFEYSTVECDKGGKASKKAWFYF